MARQRIKLVPLVDDVQQFQDSVYYNDSLTLREFLCQFPALSTSAIDESTMEQKLGQLVITVAQEPPDCPLYRPPGLVINKGVAGTKSNQSPDPGSPPIESEPKKLEVQPETISTPSENDFPKDISEKDAVRLAYALEINTTASFLRTGLSVLVVCEKLVVEHLWREMAQRANAAAFVIARRGRRFSERLPNNHHLLPSKSAYAEDNKVKHVWSHWSKVARSAKGTPRHQYFTARLNRTHSCYA